MNQRGKDKSCHFLATSWENCYFAQFTNFFIRLKLKFYKNKLDIVTMMLFFGIVN